MRQSTRRRLGTVAASLVLWGCTAAPALASGTCYAGIQGMLLTGTHTDIAGAQRGVALGAMIELGARIKRWSLRLEGIPPVSLPQKPSAYYGQATPQLSLLNGAIRTAVDPYAHVWLGVGETVINQRTPLPNLSQVVASRLGGLRFEAEFRREYSTVHFWDAIVGGAPHLAGTDHYTYSIDQPPVDKPEVASEEDVALTWGIMERDTEWLFGIRAIDFSAKYVLTGEAGDRNNGGGAIVEWRHLIDK